MIVNWNPVLRDMWDEKGSAGKDPTSKQSRAFTNASVWSKQEQITPHSYSKRLLDNHWDDEVIHSL